MKKFITIALAIVFIVAMAIPAYAFELPDSFWDKWFKDHPIDIPSITIPPETEPVEPTEPEPSEPEIIVTELSAPPPLSPKPSMYIETTSVWRFSGPRSRMPKVISS